MTRKNVISSSEVPHLRFDDSAIKPIGEPKSLSERRFLSFRTQPFINRDGKELSWDYAVRPGGQDPVAVVARTKETNKHLFIIQPRLTIRKMAISFPSGLMEPEKGLGVMETAVKELKEETGYEDPVIEWMSPPLPKSPGMTTESNNLVGATLDEGAMRETEEESDEDIHAFWMTPNDFVNMVENELDPNETQVSDGPYSYMKGYTVGQKDLCDAIEIMFSDPDYYEHDHQAASWGELWDALCRGE